MHVLEYHWFGHCINMQYTVLPKSFSIDMLKPHILFIYCVIVGFVELQLLCYSFIVVFFIQFFSCVGLLSGWIVDVLVKTWIAKCKWMKNTTWLPFVRIPFFIIQLWGYCQTSFCNVSLLKVYLNFSFSLCIRFFYIYLFGKNKLTTTRSNMSLTMLWSGVIDLELSSVMF
jgi:hypothetical protein